MIHVVYEISKKNSDRIHDIIVNSNTNWKDGSLVMGGILNSIRKDYPESEYDINVHVLTSHGSPEE